MNSIPVVMHEMRVHTPIIKHQQWNATAMANIWKKHQQLDPGQCANIKALYNNAKANHRYNVSSYSYFYSKNSAIGRELNKLGLATIDKRINGKVTNCRKFIMRDG